MRVSLRSKENIYNNKKLLNIPSQKDIIFKSMAGVAHLVRALGCGSRGSRFNPGHPPHIYPYLSPA